MIKQSIELDDQLNKMLDEILDRLNDKGAPIKIKKKEYLYRAIKKIVESDYKKI